MKKYNKHYWQRVYFYLLLKQLNKIAEIKHFINLNFCPCLLNLCVKTAHIQKNQQSAYVNTGINEICLSVAVELLEFFKHWRDIHFGMHYRKQLMFQNVSFNFRNVCKIKFSMLFTISKYAKETSLKCSFFIINKFCFRKC